MPLADPEKRREYQKAYHEGWYRKNRKRIIEQVRDRKRTKYGGKCVVCGRSTIGSTKKDPPPRYCKDHRSEQWAEKLAPEREIEIKEAIRRVPESKRPYVPKMTQEKLAQASLTQPTFSRLKHSVDRARDEKNENPPPPRKWASP